MKPENLISYGLNWIDSPEECDQSYVEGCLDTAAHIAACYIAQMYNVSVPTSDMRDILKIGDSPEEVLSKIGNYVVESNLEY